MCSYLLLPRVRGCPIPQQILLHQQLHPDVSILKKGGIQTVLRATASADGVWGKHQGSSSSHCIFSIHGSRNVQRGTWKPQVLDFAAASGLRKCVMVCWGA